MKKKLLLLEAFFVFLCLIFCSLNIYAVNDRVPKKINVQGKATTSSGQPVTGDNKSVTLYILDSSGGIKAQVTDDHVTFDSDGLYSVNFDLTGKNLDFNNEYSFKVNANGVMSDPRTFASSPNAFYASSSTYALVLSTTSDVKLADGNFNLKSTYNIKVASANYLSDTGETGQIWGINNQGKQAWVAPGSLSISSATTSTIGGLMLGDDDTGLTMTNSGVLKINNGSGLIIYSSGTNKNKIDISFGNIDQSNDTNAVTGKEIYTALSLKVSSNSAITGATKTKITYDSKGLVTKGENLTASDIPDLSGTYATVAQLNTKVSSNSAITGATKTKITYDSKGLVTGGADLAASDIPDLSGTYATLTQLYSIAYSTNTDINSLSNGQVLSYDNGKWKNVSVATLGSYSTDGTSITAESNVLKAVGINNADATVTANDGDTIQVWAKKGTTQGWFSVNLGSQENVRVGSSGYSTTATTLYFLQKGADVAEIYQSTEKLVPGDVVSIDTTKDNAIVKTKVAEDTLVAGVISTEPGVLMNQNEKGYKLALVGKVPTKVCNEGGAIKRGDLLVSASIPGYAKKAGDNPKVGTVIGKALENLDSQKGTILVLVNLQ